MDLPAARREAFCFLKTHAPQLLDDPKDTLLWALGEMVLAWATPRCDCGEEISVPAACATCDDDS